MAHNAGAVSVGSLGPRSAFASARAGMKNPAVAAGYAKRPPTSKPGTMGSTSTSAFAGVLALGLGGIAGGTSRNVGRAADPSSEADSTTPQAQAQVQVLAFAEQPGVSRPWGFYDPLNFCKSGLMTFPQQDDPTGFGHLRNAELKHGRFAMVAATGSLFASYVKLPGFENVPSGLAALGTDKGADGFALLVFLIAAHELATWTQEEEPLSYAPLRDADSELQTKELNNGRLAMFAIAGQIAAEVQTGQDPAQQFVSWAYSYPTFS